MMIVARRRKPAGTPPVPPPVPKGASTCGGCNRWWKSLSLCHCASCHRSFSGMGYFDRHRRNGQCLDPAEIRKPTGEPLLRLVDRLGGQVWASADDFDAEAAFGRKAS